MAMNDRRESFVMRRMVVEGTMRVVISLGEVEVSRVFRRRQ